ncbi:MAG: hypothetical protein ACI9W2_003691 [Gammaproteobacteria bacterium]|jgi:hypothetical protein
MRHRMSLPTRQELVQSNQQRYRDAPNKEKTTILNELAASTGLHRKYLIECLGKGGVESPAHTQPPRPRVGAQAMGRESSRACSCCGSVPTASARNA